jgi:DHA1 family bicyclomycin/chloramphenicol resistance-like MFS transporter
MTDRLPRRRLLLILAALTAFGPMSLDLYLPAFPEIAAGFGTDTGSVQLTMSACLIGLGLGQVIWGPTSDRYGRRRPLLVGLAVFITASLLIAVAPTFAALVVLRFVQAIGGSAGIVIARAIVRDVFSGVELARALSAIVTVFAIAPVVAPIIGTGILAIGSWHLMFIALALFGAACLVGVLRLPETLPVDRRTDHNVLGAARQYRAIIGNRQFRYAAAIAALGSTALFAYISSSPAVFIDSYGLSTSGFALLFAGLSVCFALGAQFNMRMLRRYPVIALLRSSVATQVVASMAVLAAALLALRLPLLLVPLVLALMTVAGVNSNGMALALDPFPRAAASAAALVGGLQMTMGGLTSAGLSALTLPPPVEMGAGMAGAGLVSISLVALSMRRAGRPRLG